MKHGNIALFVPHNGCPHCCSFCSQRSITGVQAQPCAQDVHEAVKKALASGGEYDYEIAFFGGSFTAIDRDYMVSLLEAASVYVKNGSVRGIRLSTRPDAAEDEVLSLLEKYGVTSVELGAQSLCGEVLKANLRGHTAQDVAAASERIKAHGFSLGLQMMTGLYGSTPERDIYTAEKIIELHPDTVRIYPTVTMRGTLLGELFMSGEYKPMELSESVELCASLLEMFSRNNIEVIRLGLHYSDALVRDMLFDNYHPAFRELCESRLMLRRFLAQREKMQPFERCTVYVHPSCVSKFIGQRRSNVNELSRSCAVFVKTAPDESVAPLDVRIEPEYSPENTQKVRKKRKNAAEIT